MRTPSKRYPCGRRLAALLILAASGLAACGGSGYGGGGGNMPVAGVGPSKLFLADSTNMQIGSLANSNPAAGMLTFDRMITNYLNYAGFTSTMESLALDPANDRLYAGTGTSIVQIDAASTYNGYPYPTPFPSVTISGSTGSLFLDTVHHSLYVGNGSVGVQVYDVTSGITSASTPARTISGNFGGVFTIHGVAVDTTAKNFLYVSNSVGSTNQVSVFDNATGVTGSATPARTITPTISGTAKPVGGVALDETHDVLYVAGGSTSPLVMVFSPASTADNTAGAAIPTTTLTFPANVSNVVLDVPNNRLYAISGGTVYILSGVSTAMDPITPSAVTAAGASLTAVAVNP